MQGYLTVKESSFGLYEEKHSRFIAELRPVKSEEEAFSFIKEVKAKHFNARHNVYAFRIRGDECRFSDDGEPHGTAGKPILDIILGKNLENVCIVVTRYFGGILLGTGGLVRAYSDSAKDAVNNSTIIEMGLLGLYSITCDYSQYNNLVQCIENMGGNIIDSVYTENITIKYSLRKEQYNNFAKKLTDSFAGKLSILNEGEIFAPIN